MALVLKDRVLETCTSPGTGTVTLLGAVTGYQSFSTVGNGNTCYYAIADQNGANWEVGIGTYSTAGTLARTTVLSSSNGGNLTNFSTGSQNVFLTYPSERSVNLSSAALTSGRVSFATTDGLLTDSANLVWDNTNARLGVGTSSPAKKLEIASSDTAEGIRLNSTTSGGEGLSVEWITGIGYVTADIESDASGTGGNFAIRVADTSAALQTRLLIDNAGNVGIGTTSPTAFGGFTTLELANSSGNAISLVTGTSVIAQTIASNTNSLVYTGSRSNHSLVFTTNDTERMRLDTSGQLGIGTSSPAMKLDVSSGATTSTAIFTSTATTAYSPTTSASVTNARLTLFGGNATNAYTAIRFTQSGSFENFFGAVQSSAGTGQFVWGGYNGAAYGEWMRLDSSSNLGLGITPSAFGSTYKALQVTGYAAYVGDGNNGRAEILNNAYASANNVFNYYDTNSAGRYSLQLGVHAWFQAPSGTAGNAITFTQAMTLTASGNLGIGTTDPDYGSYGATERILGVTGVATNRGRLSLQNTATGTTGVAGTIAFWNGSTVLASLDINADGATNKGLYAFNTNDGTSVSERMRITNTGDVGIGTSSPAYKFEVSMNFVGENGAIIRNTNTANNSASILRLYSGTATSAIVRFPSTHAAKANELFITNVGTTSPITFATQDTERMRIDSAGLVGIGTSSPAGKLHVMKTATGGSPQNAAGNQIVMENGDSSGSADLQFLSANNGYNHIFFGDAADANIGTLLYDHNDNSMQFVTNTAERMRIGSTGNVGIGTSSPSAKLDVNGQINTTNIVSGIRNNITSTDRISVTGATTIFSIATSGSSVGASSAVVLVNGYDTGTTTNSFTDLVLFIGGQTPVVISSVNRGSPSARTYTASGGALQLAMASGTYNVANSSTEQAC